MTWAGYAQFSRESAERGHMQIKGPRFSETAISAMTPTCPRLLPSNRQLLFSLGHLVSKSRHANITQILEVFFRDEGHAYHFFSKSLRHMSQLGVSNASVSKRYHLFLGPLGTEREGFQSPVKPEHFTSLPKGSNFLSSSQGDHPCLSHINRALDPKNCSSAYGRSKSSLSLMVVVERPPRTSFGSSLHAAYTHLFPEQ